MNAAESDRCVIFGFHLNFSSTFLPHHTSGARPHADFLSPEPPGVHGAPGEGGGVGVAPAVRRLELPMEAVPTDERVVPKAAARQVLPGAAPGADGGQPGVGAVHAHGRGEDVLVEKARFQRARTEGGKEGRRAPCSASPVAQMKVCVCVNARRLDAWGEKPHLAADQPPISHHFMDSAESVMFVTDLTFFLSSFLLFLGQVVISAKLGCKFDPDWCVLARRNHAWKTQAGGGGGGVLPNLWK